MQTWSARVSHDLYVNLRCCIQHRDSFYHLYINKLLRYSDDPNNISPCFSQKPVSNSPRESILQGNSSVGYPLYILDISCKAESDRLGC